MASARKKLDEKNLKILRELVSLSENKHCFDCHQRGPTYVNVTIGSFVCTTCSGILRGLTPPHRVKSISMATFTPEEIDFIKSRGNEYCRKVWLGTHDGSQVSKDELVIKDFMVAKYEKKRYYVKPSEMNKMSSGTRVTANQNTLKIAAPSLPPPVSQGVSNNNNVSRNHNNNLFGSQQLGSSTNKSNVQIKTSAPDPFGSLVTSNTAQSNDNFANFDNNPVFSSPTQHLSPVNNGPPPPSEDRYAALKDLDCLMKAQLAPEKNISSEWNEGWSPSSSVSQTSSVFETSSQIFDTSHKESNPFTVNQDNMAWNTVFNGNPFNTDSTWAVSNGQIPNGFSANNSSNFNTPKAQWNIGISPNPFSVSSNAQQGVCHHSSNPFL